MRSLVFRTKSNYHIKGSFYATYGTTMLHCKVDSVAVCITNRVTSCDNVLGVMRHDYNFVEHVA